MRQTNHCTLFCVLWSTIIYSSARLSPLGWTDSMDNANVLNVWDNMFWRSTQSRFYWWSLKTTISPNSLTSVLIAHRLTHTSSKYTSNSFIGTLDLSTKSTHHWSLTTPQNSCLLLFGLDNSWWISNNLQVRSPQLLRTNSITDIIDYVP